MLAKSEDISGSDLEECKFLSKCAPAYDTQPAKDLDGVCLFAIYGTIAYKQQRASRNGQS